MEARTPENENDGYRLSLIAFTGGTVNIKTWWITEDKFALLDAAMGDPDVDSIYPREYIDSTTDEIIDAGVHMVREEDDQETDTEPAD